MEEQVQHIPVDLPSSVRDCFEASAGGFVDGWLDIPAIRYNGSFPVS